MFDNTFVPLVLGKHHKYSHEDMSLLMLDHLIDDNYIDIEADDVKFVKSMIHPKSISPERCGSVRCELENFKASLTPEWSVNSAVRAIQLRRKVSCWLLFWRCVIGSRVFAPAHVDSIILFGPVRVCFWFFILLVILEWCP